MEVRLQPRGPGRAGGRALPAQLAARAVLPQRRLLRDPPRLLRADVGARRAVLAAAGQPPRHARDAPRHGGLQGQRALAGPGRRQRARRARAGEHARDPHHRPRARVPGRQGHADRPRHRRAADHARAGRLHRRQGLRRARLPGRHLPDDLRPDRRRAPRLAAREVAADRDATTRSLRRSPSTPPTSRSARCARSATSTSGASTTATRARCSRTSTTAPARTCCSTTGSRSATLPEEELYDLVFDPNEAANIVADAARDRGRAARAAGALDGGDRRPAAARPGRAAARHRRSTTRRSARRRTRR